MFNIVPQMKCVTYWLVTYTRTKSKDRPFILILKFLRKNFTFFYKQQLKISKKVIILCQEHTGYSLFENQERSGYSLFEYRIVQGTHITLSGFPECSGHSIKECLESLGSSNKEYPVCSGTSNNDLFAYFRSGISYKQIGNGGVSICQKLVDLSGDRLILGFSPI